MLNSPRILVADDVPSVLNSIVEALEVEGFEVDGVTSSTEAMYKCIDPDNHYDGLLIDIRFEQDMSGIDAAEAVRDYKLANDEDIKIVIISAYDFDSEEVLSQLGASFVRKPVDIDHIKRIFLGDQSDGGQTETEGTGG